jgi:hypothetical protein
MPRVVVSGHNFVFPAICCCCGAPATNAIAESARKKRGRQVTTKSYAFPYCEKCYVHVRTYEDAGFFSDDKRTAKAMLTGQCACVYLAADYVSWYGHQQTFDFASQHYANAFADLNRSKLQGLDNRIGFRDPSGSSALSDAAIVCVLAIVIFASVCLFWSQIVRDAPAPPPVTAGRGVGHDATVTAPIPQPIAPVQPARHRHDASVSRSR